MSDPWQHLRCFTQARLALGAAGHGLPTGAHLDFCEAHAAARDAVHARWSDASFAAELLERGIASVTLHSACATRESYLQRPDLGRKLNEESRLALTQIGEREPTRVALLVSDGLSALAVERHGLELVASLVLALENAGLGPVRVLLAPLARVALADEVGGRLGAELSLVLLGERPGLSAVDSLGGYLTYAPRVGRSDAERNCVSNIRPPEGLDLPSAVSRLLYLAREACVRQLSGVTLKDDSPARTLSKAE